MMARPPKEVLILDMPFDEALERYSEVKPKELERSVAQSKKKTKKAGNKKKVR